MDYNYLENVKEDVKNAILESYEKEELKEMSEVLDELENKLID